MSRVTVEMEIDAPPEEVWKVVSNPNNLPTWDRHVTRVDGVPDEGLSVGTKYTTEIAFVGVRARVASEVLELDPPYSSKVKLTGLLDAVVTTRITPLDDGKRSHLEHDVEYRFRGGTLGRIAAQALRLSGGPRHVLRRGVLGQKLQIEGA